MSNSQTSPDTSEKLTQHAMLVIWGLYARQIGLVQAIEQVKLKQKTRTHRPQTKVLEFLVAILAGLPYLKDISRSAHPMDQDQVTAEAWGQTAWADYNGVSRTLQQLNAEEVAALVRALDEASQPFIDQEVERALERSGELVYDADLTGRPVSSTSTSYPDVAFGHMGDTISLGYQAALVSLHSPTFGCLWLANQLHPGDTVSMTEAEALVMAAENRTGRRPKRRTELLKGRLARHEAQYDEAKVLVDRLQSHYQQLLADNAANPDPSRVVFRLDGGFASRENIYWLIEIGYDIYTRGRSPTVRDALSDAVTPETTWMRVGGNASLTAWANTTVGDYFAYPLDIAQPSIRLVTQSAALSCSIMGRQMLLLIWMLGFICMTAVKPSRLVSKRAKMSFRCIISKYARLRPFFYKSIWLVLRLTFFGLQRIG